MARHHIYLAPDGGVGRTEAPHEVGECGEQEVDVDPDDDVQRAVCDLLGQERHRRPLRHADERVLGENLTEGDEGNLVEGCGAYDVQAKGAT